MGILARHARYSIISANMKEFMLEHVVGPEDVDKLAKQ